MDDAAAAGRDHVRQDRAAHQVGAGEVDGEDGVPLAGLDVEDRAGAVVTGGAVDEDARRARRRAEGFDRGVDGRFVGDVAGDGDRPAALRLDRGGGLFRAVTVEIDAADHRADGGEALGDRSPDAGAGPDDQRRAAVEPEHLLIHHRRPHLVRGAQPSPSPPGAGRRSAGGAISLTRSRTSGLLASGAKCISRGSRRARQA